METRSKFLVTVLFSLVVVSSGCTSVLPGQNSDTSQQPRQISGKGLEVTTFKVTDNTLSPGQNAEVTLRLKNYHQREIEVGEVRLTNLVEGILEKKKLGCTPDQIEPARKGVYPVMECTWRITAGSEEDIGPWSQRKTAFNAIIPYNSTIENFQPLKVEFKPYRSINNTKKKIISYSNGEVKVEVQTESPAALRQNKTVGVRVTKTGTGSIAGNYTFEYAPSSVFNGWCPDEKKILLKSQVDFTCPIRLDSDQSSERNLFFTVHYKYVQTPEMDVTIVKTQ